MEAWAKIGFGLAFLFLSLGYLYRPAWVLRINTWGRHFIFNDSFVLLYRRRWGLLLFIFSILFFYSGFHNLAYMRSHDKRSSYLDLTDAYRSYRTRQFKGTITRCQEILKREPENTYAWTLMGSAWAALGKKDQARRAWEQALKLDPESAALSSLMELSQEKENR